LAEAFYLIVYSMPSTVIDLIEYENASCILTIRYLSGQVYHYKNVPEKVYKELIASGSKGRYLNHHIKHKYYFEKAV
jgi:hypothetical protein